jgi:hypothetical protein
MHSLLTFLGLVAAAVPLPPAGPSTTAVCAALDGYLRDYQPRLSALLAVERLQQQVESGKTEMVMGHPVPLPGLERRLESEVAFGTLPGDEVWMGFRRVRQVNGKAVTDTGPPTEDLLRQADHIAAARALLADGARYNLGRPRNTNLPNLPLELLHPRHRARFDYAVTGRARVAGTPATVLVATERARPTIVTHPDGEDLVSVVTAWIDDQGRLLEAEVRSRVPPISRPQPDRRLHVRFRHHDELGLLVPVEMREWFIGGEGRGPGVGKATYHDFRRFQTSARIVP